MSQHYSIFEDINYFSDFAGKQRGERKRSVETRFFIISGVLRIHIEERMHRLTSGQEFIVPEGHWHWVEAETDCSYLQKVDYKNSIEESR